MIYRNTLYDDEIGELIAEETNIYSWQRINEKTMLSEMERRSHDIDWISIHREEIKLLLLQGIVQKHKVGDNFSHN
jgi:hypothetical protein